MNQDDDTKNTNIKTQYLKKDDKKNLKKDLILTKESSNNNKFGNYIKILYYFILFHNIIYVISYILTYLRS